MCEIHHTKRSLSSQFFTPDKANLPRSGLAIDYTVTLGLYFNEPIPVSVFCIVGEEASISAGTLSFRVTVERNRNEVMKSINILYIVIFSSTKSDPIRNTWEWPEMGTVFRC